MTAPKLIGLCGYARSGKDTAGTVLVERFGYQRRAFADKLRELAWLIDPEIGDYVERHGYETAKRDIPQLRDLLVNIGAGARTVLGGDVWLDACLPWTMRMHLAVNPGRRIVVTDVRYPNEADRIHEIGGEVWFIDRPGVTPANPEEARTVPQCNVDAALVNNGTVHDLEHRIARLLA